MTDTRRAEFVEALNEFGTACAEMTATSGAARVANAKVRVLAAYDAGREGQHRDCRLHGCQLKMIPEKKP